MTDERRIPEGWADPNLVDRLFLRLEPVQTPLLIHCFLTLAGSLEPEMLRLAVADTLQDHPLCASLVTAGRWGFRRTLVRADAATVAEIVASHPDYDPRRERAQVQHRLDLTRTLPLRLLVQQDGLLTRLVLTIHHSVADAIGGMIWLDQLAKRYRERLQGLPPSPPPALAPSRRYRRYLRALPWRDRLKVLSRSGRALLELWEAAIGVRFATFMDQPLPAIGVTEWQTVQLPPGQVRALRDWARTQGGTLNDLLLATVIHAAWQVWPQAEAHPVSAHLPVNLRQGAPEGVFNQVADVRIRLQPEACTTFAECFAAVRRATPIARESLNGIARVFERALVGYAPPGLFARAAADHMARPENGLMSLTLSNLGHLDGLPGDFGPAQVLDGHIIGPLSSPPGMSVWATTVRERLTLTVAYHWPAVAHDSITALCRRLTAQLGALTADRHH